jgi:hypothetical protein
MTTKKKPQILGAPPYDKEYGEFVQGLDLVGLALKSCRCDLDRSAYFGLPENLTSFTHKYRLTLFTETTFDAEGNFELSVSESEDIAPPLRMECVFEVHFHGKAPLRREDVERFIGSELKLVLVPHARQFFFSLTGQMAIPPSVLPLTTRVSASEGKRTKPRRKASTIALPAVADVE